ncbi:interleukin-12 receptor subunit beta-2 [Calypte anna]|nr:interleukin-12 receptor subunit beta-2 [Calypte anna]
MKANRLLGCTKKGIASRDEEGVIPPVRPHLEYCVQELGAEPCGKATVPTPPKRPQGATETCDRGKMMADTAAHVQPGTTITLSCQLSPPHHSFLAIFLNGSALSSGSGSSISTRFLVQSCGRHTFTCKTLWQHRRKIICGIDIEAGNPPDEPRNVSCVQEGSRGHPSCTWEKGRFTHIPTTYLLQLSKGTDDVLCFPEQQQEESLGSLGSLALSKLDWDSTYTVVVIASNQLGTAVSQPLSFMLRDIVKPHPPDLLLHFGSSSTASCTLSWEEGTPAHHCHLRYHPLTSTTWSRVENVTSEKCSLDGLEPHTTYEFQVSCKIHPERGLWSNWRIYQAQTPEAVPTGHLDLWYRQQEVGSQGQSISLFWKALSKWEAGGHNLSYRVTFEALGQQTPPAESQLTTQSSCTRLLPSLPYRITLTAENSRGRSPPTSILTEPGTQVLPPPQQVSAVPQGSSSILVSWRAPSPAPVPITGYVVEWAGTQRSPEPAAWVKVPAPNLSTLLAENIQENLCYEIRVSALYQDRAGQVASVWGHSGAEAPSAGFQMYSTPEATSILTSWDEIPAQLQRGCTPGHQVQLQRKGWEEAPDVPSAGDWVTLVLTCSFFILAACTCSVPPARKGFQSLLSALLPQSGAIPDPSNAAWAKDFLALKAELRWPSTPFLHNTSIFEEPQTTPVEENFMKTKALVMEGSNGRRDKWLGQEELGYKVVPGSGQGEEGDEQHLPYKQLGGTGPTQNVSEYIANPMAEGMEVTQPPASRDGLGYKGP